MKILFIGDSITRGKLGASFVDIIARNDPKYKITNLGNDGETMNVITERLINHLKTENNYEYIILQGGYNDLLLPTFRNKGTMFNFAYNHQLKNGHNPLTDQNNTYLFFKETITEIKQLFHGKIMLLTIACVGENLNSELNAKRNDFNQAIKKISEEENLILLDVGNKFEIHLKDKIPSDYCLNSFLAVTLFDKMTSDFNKLSSKRKLFLTIDGVHLNKTGAEIFANCISKELEN